MIPQKMLEPRAFIEETVTIQSVAQCREAVKTVRRIIASVVVLAGNNGKENPQREQNQAYDRGARGLLDLHW